MTRQRKRKDPKTPTRAQHTWAITEEVIRLRAYQLWEQDPTRSAEENWRQAASELTAAAGAPSAAQQIGSASTDASRRPQ